MWQIKSCIQKVKAGGLAVSVLSHMLQEQHVNSWHVLQVDVWTQNGWQTATTNSKQELKFSGRDCAPRCSRNERMRAEQNVNWSPQITVDRTESPKEKGKRNGARKAYFTGCPEHHLPWWWWTFWLRIWCNYAASAHHLEKRICSMEQDEVQVDPSQWVDQDEKKVEQETFHEQEKASKVDKKKRTPHNHRIELIQSRKKKNESQLNEKKCCRHRDGAQWPMQRRLGRFLLNWARDEGFHKLVKVAVDEARDTEESTGRERRKHHYWWCHAVGCRPRKRNSANEPIRYCASMDQTTFGTRKGGFSAMTRGGCKHTTYPDWWYTTKTWNERHSVTVIGAMTSSWPSKQREEVPRADQLREMRDWLFTTMPESAEMLGTKL